MSTMRLSQLSSASLKLQHSVPQLVIFVEQVLHSVDLDDARTLLRVLVSRSNFLTSTEPFLNGGIIVCDADADAPLN